MSLKNKGVMVILSSPSGAGKTTLVKLLSEEDKYKISISHTTRKPRLNEKNGIDYWEAYTNTGREHTGMNIIDWAKKGIDLGVGEILLTSIDNEGTILERNIRRRDVLSFVYNTIESFPMLSDYALTGNSYVDYYMNQITRSDLYLLLPISIVLSIKGRYGFISEKGL